MAGSILFPPNPHHVLLRGIHPHQNYSTTTLTNPEFLTPTWHRQIFELRNRNFRESLEEDHPSLDAAVHPAAKGGEEGEGVHDDHDHEFAQVCRVQRELDCLNDRYQETLTKVREKMMEIGKALEEEMEEEEDAQDAPQDEHGQVVEEETDGLAVAQAIPKSGSKPKEVSPTDEQPKSRKQRDNANVKVSDEPL